MKSISFLFLFSILSAYAFAQTSDSSALEVKTLTVEETTKAMSKGTQPAFKVTVYEATKKGTAEALSKAIKEENRSKVETKDNESYVLGTVIKSISPKPLNVYCIINEYEDRVEIFFFYEMDSVFLTKEKNETEYLAARKFTRDFAVKAYKAAVQERIGAEEKKLSGYQKQFDDIVKENDKLHKKIDEEKRVIDNTKEKISTSELDQERVRKQVQDDKTELARLKTGGNPETVKEGEKKLKASESELSKLQKQEDGYHKDVTKSEGYIRDYERNITDNEAAMKQKQEEIAKQKDFVYKLQKKLESIK